MWPQRPSLVLSPAELPGISAVDPAGLPKVLRAGCVAVLQPLPEHNPCAICSTRIIPSQAAPSACTGALGQV